MTHSSPSKPSPYESSTADRVAADARRPGKSDKCRDEGYSHGSVKLMAACASSGRREQQRAILTSTSPAVI